MLIKKATAILNRLFIIAGKLPRNYIVDQVGGAGLVARQFGTAVSVV